MPDDLAWHDRFPGLEFLDTDPGAFVPKKRVADHFEAQAREFATRSPRRRGQGGAQA